MQEAFLHYLWRQQRLAPGPWRSTSGDLIYLKHRGYENSLGGPDFLEAKLSAGATDWAGHIEIHLRSSDWYRHQHHKDAAYRNVILHVVYEEDEVIYHQDGSPILCLELKGLFEASLYWRYEQLLAQEQAIPCGAYFRDLPPIAKMEMLDRMAVARLQSKMHFLERLYHQSKGDWESVFSWSLAYSLGLKANGEPMLRMLQSLDRKVWQHYQEPFDLEALFLGQAGLLENADPQFKAHQKQYQFLKHKHQLDPPTILWKYGGVRPAAFPDRRIAFLVQALLDEEIGHVPLTQFLDLNFKSLFKLELKGAWAHFYRCRQKSAMQSSVSLGEGLRNHIIINMVVPYRFFYGLKTGQRLYQDQALIDLEQIPPEFNKIVRVYEQLALPIRSALDSQAVLEWYRRLCGPKKCLNCALGNSLLKD